jgi:hypothetical protein
MVVSGFCGDESIHMDVRAGDLIIMLEFGGAVHVRRLESGRQRS